MSYILSINNRSLNFAPQIIILFLKVVPKSGLQGNLLFLVCGLTSNISSVKKLINNK